MVTRHISNQIERSLKYFPAVLLIGARQVGKSTLSKQIINQGLLKHYVTLDDLNYLEAASHDPDGFLAGLGSKVAIDEIQHVPDLMRAIKFAIDKDRKNGQYLLTGSANVLAYPHVKESLAGRVDVIHLEGLSLGEQMQQAHPSSLIAELFSHSNSNELISHFKERLLSLPPLDMQTILNAIFYGGFPSVALAQDPYMNKRWFSSYQTTYVERDVRDAAKSVDIIPFAKLLRLAALRTGNLLVISNIAKDAGMDQRTVLRYLGIVELTFQCNRLMPWHANVNKRLVKTPKIFCNDSGFASYYCGITEAEQLHPSPFLGALAETWLWSELRKLLVFQPDIQASFYRTHLSREIDFVLHRGKQFVGIEFKFAQSVSLNDFLGLKDMQSEVPNMLGIVLYTGDEPVAFSDKLIALPIRLLI